MSHRRERVAHDLRHHVAELLEHTVRDPRLQLLTVTDVEVSRDLSVARVYYRTPASANADDVERALEKAKPFLRRLLADRTRLKRVPELAFHVDWGVDRGERVEQILSDLAADSEGAEDEA